MSRKLQLIDRLSSIALVTTNDQPSVLQSILPQVSFLVTRSVSCFILDCVYCFHFHLSHFSFFLLPTFSPSTSSSPTSTDAGMAQSLSHSLTSSRAAAAVARGGRGLWLWLAIVVVLAGIQSFFFCSADFKMILLNCREKTLYHMDLNEWSTRGIKVFLDFFQMQVNILGSLAGLLALLASLVMQPVVDAAPVGTGDSWMTIQQLLWPYAGLRHNGQPPV